MVDLRAFCEKEILELPEGFDRDMIESLIDVRIELYLAVLRIWDIGGNGDSIETEKIVSAFAMIGDVAGWCFGVAISHLDLDTKALLMGTFEVNLRASFPKYDQFARAVHAGEERQIRVTLQ